MIMLSRIYKKFTPKNFWARWAIETAIFLPLCIGVFKCEPDPPQPVPEDTEMARLEIAYREGDTAMAAELAKVDFLLQPSDNCYDAQD